MEIQFSIKKLLDFSFKYFLFDHAKIFSEQLFYQCKYSLEYVYKRAESFIFSNEYKIAYTFLKSQKEVWWPDDINNTSTNSNHYLYGVICFQLEKYEKAKRMFKLILRDYNHTKYVPIGVVCYQLGRCYQKIGDLDKAKQYYKKTLKKENQPLVFKAYMKLCEIGEDIPFTMMKTPFKIQTFDQKMIETPVNNMNQQISVDEKTPSPFPQMVQPPNIKLRKKTKMPETPGFVNIQVQPPNFGDDEISFLSPIYPPKKTIPYQNFQQNQQNIITPNLNVNRPNQQNLRPNQFTNVITPTVKKVFSTESTPQGGISQVDLTKKSSPYKGPNIYEIFSVIANGYRNMCHFRCSKALEYYNRLPKEIKESGWIKCQIAKCFYELEQYNKSRIIFESVTKVEPFRMDNMDIFSTVLWHLKRSRELMLLSAYMKDVDSNNVNTLVALGNAYSSTGEHITALSFFEKVILVSPKSAIGYTLKGHEYLEIDKMNKALICFQKAIEYDSRNYKAWFGIGLVNLRMEKYQQAKSSFFTAVKIKSYSSVIWIHLGIAESNLKKHNSALKYFDKALEISKENPFAMLKKAESLISLGRFDEAIVLLEELKKNFSEEPAIFKCLAEVFSKVGDKRKSFDYYQRAIYLKNKVPGGQFENDGMIDLDEFENFIAENFVNIGDNFPNDTEMT